MSKVAKLRTALESGKSLTPRQITSRFKLANPRAAISALRAEGMTINYNAPVNDRGGRGQKYSLNG